MAEEENGQEKTEEATPKRREKAREEGQVARSRELGTTLLLMTAGASLLGMGSVLASRMQEMMRSNFDFQREAALDPAYMFAQLESSVMGLLSIVGLLLTLLMIAGALGAIALGGWLFSAKPLMPKFNRLNPVEGLKRMFSVQSLIELVKAIGKFLLVALVAVLTLNFWSGDLMAVGMEPLEPALAHATTTILWATLAMSATTILIAAIDVPYQIFDNSKKLRMTKQQVKDEFKDSEGKPEVKSRVRQLQRELAQSRMMSAIPEADVVITNPEHFSVALRYDMQSEGAPRVVAKGADEVALKIREVANANAVPVLRTPLLTRAIYFTTEIDEQIPEQLYMAVAQVLAYIFQLRSDMRLRNRSSAAERALQKRLDIPDAYRFDNVGELDPG